MLLPIVGRKQLVELFAPKMFEAPALISSMQVRESSHLGSGSAGKCEENIRE